MASKGKRTQGRAEESITRGGGDDGAEGGISIGEGGDGAEGTVPTGATPKEGEVAEQKEAYPGEEG